jgi:5-(carboxyamino)imidazole ribonucleotide mutase
MPTGGHGVAVDGGKTFDAELAAVQVLSRAHPELEERVDEYHDSLQDGVGEVSRELHEQGTELFRANRD